MTAARRGRGPGRAARERLSQVAAMRLHAGSATTPLPGYITAQQAAERLGVSVRTIQRDKQRIREASQ